MVYWKNIKLGAILGIGFAIFIFLICLIYAVFSTLSLAFLLLIGFYAAFQIFIFAFSINLLFTKKKTNQLIFLTGIINLFAFFAPGLIILISYFRLRKEELNTNPTTS